MIEQFNSYSEFSERLLGAISSLPFSSANEKMIVVSTLEDVLLDLQYLIKDKDYTPQAYDNTLKATTLLNVIKLYQQMFKKPDPFIRTSMSKLMFLYSEEAK